MVACGQVGRGYTLGKGEEGTFHLVYCMRFTCVVARARVPMQCQ